MNAGRELLARPVAVGIAAGVLVGALVLLVTQLRADEYEGRISLVAGPAPEAAGAQYGEVVSLTLPALVELARSPSVLGKAATETGMSTTELAAGVGVELVPASGLARLSVLGPSAELAGTAATAIARAVIDANLLAPVGELRLLDERPDVARVAPDRPLGAGLALAAGAVAGVAAGTLRRLRAAADPGVRAALAAAGTNHPVTTFRDRDPALPVRLAALCAAAARPARVIAVAPDLARRAEAVAGRLPYRASAPTSGTSVIAVTHNRRQQEDLAAMVSVLPADAVLVAVVLA